MNLTLQRTRLQLYLALTLVVICMSLFNIRSYASSYIPQTLQALIKESDAVIMGTVSKIEVSQDYPNKEIYTVITLAKSQSISSSGFRSLGGDFKYRQWGGTVVNGDEIGETWSIGGAPEFEVNDAVVLFISQNGYREIPVFGGKQGMYRVSSDGVVLDSEFSPLKSLNTNVYVRDLSSPTVDNNSAKPVLVSFDNVVPESSDLLSVDSNSTSKTISIDDFELAIASLASIRERAFLSEEELLRPLPVPGSILESKPATPYGTK